MPVAPLLQRFADEELTRTPAFIARVRAGTLQLLREPGAGASERAHALELQAALQKQAELYHTAFADSLRALVETELRQSHADAGTDRRALHSAQVLQLAIREM